ncbi:4'-phosphopantetheinyl transferase superfamily protein [Sphingomonas sanguinis]|uniref:4'-phosphopantetheinyl transferase superfamily protein n=1 Tax=Sphingomonas sanguinis TaxID=33051 RepID=A0ABU5LSE3_9SPHN|nr:4'-phosphopantetheinyl transferase superfamily protein [Sphingomonas sanguinis]MDZ7282855.1 4'-phosphopantetheinyl transferase superfamily protein [Sphingomonas sanguinis]
MIPLRHDGPLDRLDWDGAVPVVWRARDPGRGKRAPLADALLARLTGASVRLARSATGQPQVASPAGWYLGIAGRGGACLIAAARRPIAVDREVVDDAPPLWDMLTPVEAQDVRAAADTPRAWLRRWTIKEAHAKLIGDPRRIAAETIETRLIDDHVSTAHREGERASQCWTRDEGGAIETVALWA